MTPDNKRRPVTIDRTSNGHYTVSDARGGTISVGNGSDDSFTLVFPDGQNGDKARALLPEAVKISHERLCPVSRTVEAGTPIGFTLE